MRGSEVGRSAAGLLPNMEARLWKDGKTISYRYKAPGGAWIGLGTDKIAALRHVVELSSERSEKVGTPPGRSRSRSNG